MVTLPGVGSAGACLPPKPVQKTSGLPGPELPSVGQDLEAAQFLRMLDQAAGGSAVGLTPWGFPSANRPGNPVVGSQPTPQQLQSKRLQQSMVMRGGNVPMPGHGRKVKALAWLGSVVCDSVFLSTSIGKAGHSTIACVFSER
jgi:hypothetical protein